MRSDIGQQQEKIVDTVNEGFWDGSSLTTGGEKMTVDMKKAGANAVYESLSRTPELWALFVSSRAPLIAMVEDVYSAMREAKERDLEGMADTIRIIESENAELRRSLKKVSGAVNAL